MNSQLLQNDTEAQIAEIRRMLRSCLPCHQEQHQNSTIDTLIALLLESGVTRDEIAFLIAESLPCDKMPQPLR